ncbi:MAG: alkaline phosphatase family protein [Cyclobacteriaceae bacterium]|nr:alkaline phosphatase family protein [Cyclobacteriaceae bacterium]
MKNISLLILLTAWLSVACGQPPVLTRIAFGSCSNEELHDEMWTDIAAQKPGLCILLGDNIYGDTHDMTWMRAQYDQQKNLPGYQLLLKTCPVIGTWDDHDYGQNDGGKYYPKKKESKEEFMRFFDIAPDDPIRSHEGVYSSHTYGPKGKRVKVILLDTRYFRDTTVRSPQRGRRYEPNPDGDVLGEGQWAWFENEIRNSEADVHLIGSSIQFIAAEHGYEKWANFPKARQRMLDLLVKHKPRNVLFLSGDRHIAEISRMEVPGLGQPLYDFTSSGLTHTWNVNAGMPPTESNRYRVSRFIIQKNFGLVEIDWSGSQPVIRMEIRGKSNALWDEPLVIR